MFWTPIPYPKYYNEQAKKATPEFEVLQLRGLAVRFCSKSIFQISVYKTMASQEPQPSQSPDTTDGALNGQHNGEEIEAPGISPFTTLMKEPEYVHGFQLFTILAAVTSVCFLMLLDGTIVVAATPRITDDFNSLEDIGWYGAAYQLGRYVDTSLGRVLYSDRAVD
jgi:hypothetical protein